mmetsp:Transcript_2757/g.5905  ORF Transcript_2757/g.5905 Transcript_2757/m.5905 type:complete len:98 (+) Transcript_2757:159-452(+)
MVLFLFRLIDQTSHPLITSVAASHLIPQVYQPIYAFKSKISMIVFKASLDAITLFFALSINNATRSFPPPGLASPQLETNAILLASSAFCAKASTAS